VATVLQQLPGGSRVVVVRLRSLGDCVLTTPALEVLKCARPDLKVAVVVEDRFAAVFEGNPDVDKLLGPTVREVAGWKPRLCLDLHGGTRSLALTVRSGAAFRAGFGHYRYSLLYNVQIPTAQEILGVRRKVHTAEHLASAMFYLGAPKGEIPRSKLFGCGGARREARAVIHAFASAPGKTWPAEKFVEVARRIREDWRLEPVFVAGPADDLTPFREFRTMAGAPLREVKALLESASLFVGNDSGPAHMAAAFQVPSAVIFGETSPEIWGPWKAPARALVAHEGIANLAVSEVLEALQRLRAAA
jgi:heptosyltransferase-3